MFIPLWIYSPHYHQPFNTCPGNVVWDIPQSQQLPSYPSSPAPAWNPLLFAAI